jgi:hypothetical protein
MSTTLGLSAAEREADKKRQAPARVTRQSKKKWRGYFMGRYLMRDGTQSP